MNKVGKILCLVAVIILGLGIVVGGVGYFTGASMERIISAVTDSTDIKAIYDMLVSEIALLF